MVHQANLFSLNFKSGNRQPSPSRYSVCSLRAGTTKGAVCRKNCSVTSCGAAGLIARLVGKQPSTLQAWVLAEDAPAFVRFDGPLYSGGPTWRMEIAIPAAWPDNAVKSQQ
jgi:hypothetical protein